MAENSILVLPLEIIAPRRFNSSELNSLRNDCEKKNKKREQIGGFQEPCTAFIPPVPSLFRVRPLNRVSIGF